MCVFIFMLAWACILGRNFNPFLILVGKFHHHHHSRRHFLGTWELQWHIFNVLVHLLTFSHVKCMEKLLCLRTLSQWNVKWGGRIKCLSTQQGMLCPEMMVTPCWQHKMKIHKLVFKENQVTQKHSRGDDALINNWQLSSTIGSMAYKHNQWAQTLAGWGHVLGGEDGQWGVGGEETYVVLSVTL